jgi:outer membrane protein assembly factor BamB
VGGEVVVKAGSQSGNGKDLPHETLAGGGWTGGGIRGTYYANSNFAGVSFQRTVTYHKAVGDAKDDAAYGSTKFRVAVEGTPEEVAEMEQAAGKKDVGSGGLMAADGKLIILSRRGELILAQASPAAYTEIARAQFFLKDACWNGPVLSDGRIYVRNEKGTLVCLDVRRN